MVIGWAVSIAAYHPDPGCPGSNAALCHGEEGVGEHRQRQASPGFHPSPLQQECLVPPPCCCCCSCPPSCVSTSGPVALGTRSSLQSSNSGETFSKPWPWGCGLQAAGTSSSLWLCHWDLVLPQLCAGGTWQACVLGTAWRSAVGDSIF
jgi:hypothetical protein